MIGQSIQQYRIEELLGEGGMGTVYRGTDTTLDRPVAIKVLHSHLLRDGSFLDRFRNEAIILGRLNHPNIANLYSFQQQGGQWYMIMEYVDGPTFEQLLRQGGALSVEKAFLLMGQVLEGLQHAHSRGVLHRDIKPANLMLTREGKVKLMDFGIARVVGAQRLTRMNHVVGTLEYMAPELIEGRDPSVQSDLYAAGVLFYELLSGKLPFEGTTESALISAIVNKSPIPLSKQVLAPPRGIESILARLLHKKAEKRFGSADELRLALVALARESTPKPKRPYAPPQTRVLLGPAAAKKWFSDVVPPRFLTTNPFKQIPKGKLLSPESAVLAVAVLIALAILLVGEKYIKKASEAMEVPSDTLPIMKPTDGFRELTLSTPDTSRSLVEVPRLEPDAAQPPLSVVPIVQRTVPEEPAPEPRKARERTKVPDEKKEQPKKEESTPAENVAVREEKKEEKKSEVPEKAETVVEEAKPISPTVSTHRIVLRGEPVLLELVETLSSEVPNAAGKSVRLRAVNEVVSRGVTVIAAGAPATGTITKVRPAAGNSRSFLEFELDKVQAVNGQWIPLKNPPIGRSGSSLQAVEFAKSTRISAKVGTVSLTIKSLN
ncbi:hypothetical protein GCM10027275_52600 [Rhabdobacter roseus]|uniref:non-specific serine/threonine protein kinase n=1 Tax=Rhabdobacter roseus TaxID=1655419 RepID=A0A840TWM7_9BACT|nr:serine/threonine-protein kinase [Rhabdobacter roseus]MBB5287335.1 serine/threonine-protein kinase [Rhabdobacter roseus]